MMSKKSPPSLRTKNQIITVGIADLYEFVLAFKIEEEEPLSKHEKNPYHLPQLLSNFEKNPYVSQAGGETSPS